MDNKIVNKICNHCAVEKPINEYPENKNSRDKHSNKCKICTNEYYKTYKIKRRASKDTKLTDYLEYKLINIKKQDKKKFPDYENELGVQDLLDVYNACNKRCVYSGKLLKPGAKVNIYAKISYDRIDNNLPHSRDNLQLTSQYMNYMRGGMSYVEFKELLNAEN